MKSNLLFLVAAMAMTLATNAYAFPLANKNTKFTPAMLMSFSAKAFDFEGIAELSNCSGSLIRFENSLDTDKAVLLTNGHCYEGGFAAPGQFTSHVASTRTFGLLKSNLESAGEVTAAEVVYSTMTITDITIYKLTDGCFEESVNGVTAVRALISA